MVKGFFRFGVGYVKNEMLAFGSDAVARAAAIDMTNPQDAKTLEEIAAEEAAKKAAEEEAARKAAEEAARQSGSSVRYDEACQRPQTTRHYWQQLFTVRQGTSHTMEK